MGGTGSGNKTASNPCKQKSMQHVDPDTNRKCIDFLLTLNSWPRVDFSDAQAVDQRGEQFFMLCAEREVKPLMGSFATALGYDATTIQKARHGDYTVVKGLTPKSISVLKKWAGIIEAANEYELAHSKGSPVAWIFLLKAQHRWTDTPAIQPQAPEPPRLADAGDVMQRYAALIGASVQHELSESGIVYELPAKAVEVTSI